MKKIFAAVKGFFTHWNTPAEGNYVPSKEVVAYSVGGMGVQFIAAISAAIQMNASCLLLGSIYGMKPTTLATIATVSSIVLLVLQPLKAYLIDHAPGHKGKARPWLLWMSFPCAVLMSALAYMDPGWNAVTMAVVVGVLFVIMNFIYQFYYGQYTMLAYLISPNSTERTTIITISSLVYSLAPTITGAIFPLISTAFPNGQLDQDFYRLIFPLFTGLGVLITLLCYFGTKERIIIPKSYNAEVKFLDGMKKIIRNKYLWIINIATWMQFARAGLTNILTWVYIYMLQNAEIQSALSLVMGTASGIGMFVAPFLVRFFGKRNTAIASNLLVTVSAILLIIFPGSMVLLYIVIYLNLFGIAVQIITQPAMNADALDYQQWKTGDRYEGISGNLGMIGQAIALGTNFVIPVVQEQMGIIDDYDVLFDPVIRDPIFRAMAVVAAVGGLGVAIPYFFWDLSEKKHRAIIEELKLRAEKQNVAEGFENASILSSGEITDTVLKEEKALKKAMEQSSEAESAVACGEIRAETSSDDEKDSSRIDETSNSLSDEATPAEDEKEEKNA